MDIAAWLSRAILRIDMLLLTKATSNVFPAPQRAVKRLFILRYFPTEATLLIGAMQEHDLRRKTVGRKRTDDYSRIPEGPGSSNITRFPNLSSIVRA